MFKKGTPEYRAIAKLNTPLKIQAFLDSIPFNLEEDGETCMSARRVLSERKAHCMEAGFFAAACLMCAGEKPIIVSLKVKKPDDDHILIIFKQHGHYGALSKTSHPVLRYRDPIYRSIRELVMSYFHEYFLFANGKKTLVGYTNPINLKRFGTKWITAPEDLWDIAEQIYHLPVLPVVPEKNKKFIRIVPEFERKALDVLEWG